MKNFKFLLLSFSIIIGLVSHAQTDTLMYRFNNYAVIPGTTNDTLVFDLEIMSPTPGTYLVGFQSDVIFSEDAFGTNALPVETNRLALVANLMVYNMTLGPANPATNTFRLAINHFSMAYDTSILSLVPTATWGPLVQFKLLIVDNTFAAGMQLDIAAMTGQTNYVMVIQPPPALVYDPVLADNDLLTYPLYPEVFNLFISEVADPETPDANAKFVEIYNPSPYPVDFFWYNWTISRQANGGSWADASLTTGVIGAMSTFVVAYQQAAFFTAYGFDADDYNGYISGNGDDTYALLKGPGYWGGGTDLIDIYGVIDVDGTGEVWEYKDTKAVRHSDVTGPNPTWTYSEWAIGPRNLSAMGTGTLVAYGSDMTPKSYRETYTWTGAAKSSDWRDKGNWDLGYIPDAATDVVLNASPGPTVGAIAYAYCHDINIASGTGDGLLIESYNDGSTDGSIITYGTVTGLATVQRNLIADVWHYVSMPVGSEFAMVFYHCFLRKYDEAAGDWVAWIEPETTPLDLMDGYAVWAPTGNPLFITTDTTTQYIGTLNSGAQNTALTRVTDGFNFTGNPYQSSLDWDGLGWDKAALETDAYYVWNDTSYASYVGGVGTNDATRFIPQQQGFFVKAATGGGNFGMDNLSRTHSVSSFMKDAPVFTDLLRLAISNEEYADEIVIRFNENATTGIDFNYDAHKFFAWVSPQLFTLSETHKMAINALNNITESPAVSMGFTIPESGEYTITASNIESFLNTPIFLEDIKESKIINLRESSTYTFSATTQEDPMRFIIHFTDQLGIDDPVNADVNNIYAFNKDVYVNFTGQNGAIFIYNLMGQKVYQGVASNGLNKITLEKGNAAYIVKVISDNTIVSEKVFLR